MRKQLKTLKADPGTPKMIWQVVYAMEQHAELDKVVRDWRKKTVTQRKKWDEVKNHFILGICKIEINMATKKEIGYANEGMEEKMEEMGESTKFPAQQVIQGQDSTKKLKEKLEELRKIPTTDNTTQAKLPTDEEKFMELLQKND